MQAALKGLLGNDPVQMEINQGLITVKDKKGEYLFSLKGKVRVETKLQEREKCNSKGRKKELVELEDERKELRDLAKRFDEREKKILDDQDKIAKRENQLEEREKEIKGALKTLCKD